MNIKPVPPSVAVTAAANVPLPNDLVARINSYLSQPWSTYNMSNGRWLDCSIVITHGATNEAVIRAYSEAGWSVRYVSDQRDGDSLVFHPPKETT